LEIDERYWLWAGLLSEAEASNLMIQRVEGEIYQRRKSNLLHALNQSTDFNNILYSDLNMVLLSDMLRKVDLMSMSCGLEVRTPFLDHKLVNFAFQLPAEYKINEFSTKRILRDIARDHLPEELISKPKQGFEVPLWSWLNHELHDLVYEDLLSTEFLQEQNLFNVSYVSQLKKKLKSKNPADVQANIWALVVFNHWWKRYIA
jgi:asparagine synthase (glutamine-hydrolysing)